MAIDPSAKIAPGVELAPDVEVGPGVIIDGPSTIGAGTRILANAYIGPYTTIGEHNLIGFGAIVGYDPQDYAFTGEESYTIIGDHNRIREYVTIHRGTTPGSATRVGNHNFLMALSHLAHNSRLGDHVVVVNGALVGGYVEVADRAFISANCLLHQFIRVGTLAIMRGGSRASRDIPPYAVIDDTHTGQGGQSGGVETGRFCFPNHYRPAPGLPAALLPPGQPQGRPGAGGAGSAPDSGSSPPPGIHPRLETGRGYGPQRRPRCRPRLISAS